MSVRRVGLAAVILMLAAAVPSEAEAAEAVSCVDQYLSCINVASQEGGALWRTAKETECGVDYYACMRRKIIGA